ncbi:MAG: LysM peptidoglycan-binding domain-containing protein, partial [Gammaproteobacteria bacterium]|nr:LysM peptidoglycan-binding domain-containing protein [Gammaproteobacteria bacterium]
MTENILLRSTRYLWPLCVLAVGLLGIPEVQAVERGTGYENSPLVIKKDHPQRYSVVRGDTLWDISDHFLRDPWRWPELWQKNQQIDNPHLIYPGDILTLVYIDGVPTL